MICSSGYSRSNLTDLPGDESLIARLVVENTIAALTELERQKSGNVESKFRNPNRLKTNDLADTSASPFNPISRRSTARWSS